MNRIFLIAMIVLGGLCLLPSDLAAQDLPLGFKNYYNIGLDMRLSKRWTARVKQLYGFDVRPDYQLRLLLNTVSLEYRTSRATRLEVAYRPMYFRGNTRYLWYHRISARASHSWRFDNRMRWKNSLTAEWFFPQQPKYKYRFIWTSRIYLPSVLPWRGRPYLQGQLYYYLDGKPLKYYDENGEWLVTQSPNDFHRYRLSIGARFRPNRVLRLSVYYTLQQEFNTNLTQNRDINVPNRTGTDIRYDFNNYTILGASLTIRMDLRK